MFHLYNKNQTSSTINVTYTLYKNTSFSSSISTHHHLTIHNLSFWNLDHPSMATLAKLLAKRRNLFISGQNLFGAKNYTSQPLPESFVKRLRDLPKDLPGTNIKRDASQVHSNSFFLMFYILCFYLCDKLYHFYWTKFYCVCKVT